MSSFSSSIQQFLLRKKTKESLISVAAVMAVVLLIIFLSKWNHTRHQALPTSVRRRLKSGVVTAAKHLKFAENSPDAYISFHHALTADSMLKALKDLTGEDTLENITGFNIAKLEESIESLMNDKAQAAETQAKAKKLTPQTKKRPKPMKSNLKPLATYA
jgi:hypothetical protein